MDTNSKNIDERTYDVIVYGATGDTGSACARLLYHFADKFNMKKWTMCCRNLKKLNETVIDPLLQASPNGFKWTGDPIQADSENLESLIKMCNQTKVVIACAGPYAYYGEQVIAACIKGKCSYVDVTGETDWVNDMRKFYGQAAKDAGVSIVSFCGYDSVPSDISAWMLANALREHSDPPSVIETYVASETAGGGAMPSGTIKTALRMVNNLRYKYSFGILGIAPEKKKDAKVKELESITKLDDPSNKKIMKRTKRDIANNNSNFKSKILKDGNAIKNSVHGMGRINIGVVHETAVRDGFDDFQYFERSINGGRDAWEIHNGNVSKSSNNNSGLTAGIDFMTILQAPFMALTPWFDNWVMSKVKQINSAGSSDSDKQNLVQRLMNEGKGTGYVGMTGFAISTSKKLFAKSTFETNWEAGIGTTMACACAVANVLANNKTNYPRNGFETPVMACGGNNLRDALIDAGATITCEVSPVGSKL